MKTRRIICFLLSIIFCLTVGFPVYGLEAGLEEKSVSVVYNNAVTSVDVLVDSEQNIYMTTEYISKFTPFSFSENESSFFYDDQIDKSSCTKEISISAESSTVTIINYWLNTMPVVTDLSGFYQYNDKLYLPIAEIFPCLDTVIEVTDGKLIIMPVATTVSRALCNVNLDDYLFNMYYTETKAAGFICTLYEDLSHLRVSRLPIVRNAVRITETKHYEDVFTDYLLDNSVYTAAMNDIVDSKETIARSLINSLDDYKKDQDTSKFFYLPPWIASVVIDRNAMDESEKWGFDKKVGRTLGTIEKVSDGFYDAVSVYTAYQFHVADNLNMLNAVYDLEDESYNYSLFMSKDKTEAHAAQKIYKEYSNGLLVALLNSVSDTAFKNIADLIKDKATDKICELFGARFNSFLIEIERILINKMFPSFATTSGNLEILPYHYKIANTALSDYYTSQRLGFNNSGENINRARLRLILYLTSSKYCYKAIQNSADAYKDKGFSNICEKHIKQIDELLSKLYLAAFSIDCDSYEKLEESINANQQAISNLELSEPLKAFDLYKQFFEAHYQLSDLVVLADVTHDGNDEMIVTTIKDHYGEDLSSPCQSLFYSIINGEVKQIYEIHGGLMHADGFFDIYLIPDGEYYNIGDESHAMWQGHGELRFDEYYITTEGERINASSVSSNDINLPNDADGSISDAGYKAYVQLLNERIKKSFIIYSNWTSATVEAQPIETNPTIVLDIGAEKKSNLPPIADAPYTAYTGILLNDNVRVTKTDTLGYWQDLPQGTEMIILYDDPRSNCPYYVVCFGEDKNKYGYVEKQYIQKNAETVTLYDTQFYEPLAEYLYRMYDYVVEGGYTGFFDVDYDDHISPDDYNYCRAKIGKTKADLIDLLHTAFSAKYDNYNRIAQPASDDTNAGSINDCFDNERGLYKEKNGGVYIFEGDYPFASLNELEVKYQRTEENEVWFSMKATWNTSLEFDFSLLLENNIWKIGAVKYPY